MHVSSLYLYCNLFLNGRKHFTVLYYYIISTRACGAHPNYLTAQLSGQIMISAHPIA
jgi:hypothetical protein